MLDRRHMTTVFLLAGAVGACALGVVAFRSAEDRLWRDRLPGGLEVEALEYRKIADGGVGPGGNSQGIMVYRLRDGSAEGFLKHGTEVSGRDDRHPRRWTYWDWARTPVRFDHRWTRHGDHMCGREPGIGAFIDWGSFRCAVDPVVIKRVNGILSRPGAYYAYGSGSSVIIVAPAEALVILAFNG